MREPANIKKVVAINPDFLGLIFYPKSKRFVSDSDYLSINQEIPETIKKVGVFVNEDQHAILRRIKLFGLNLIQLHGDESPSFCKGLRNEKVEVIKSFGIDTNFDFSMLESYQNACDYFLFDTKSINYGGTGIRFDWKILEKYSNTKPFFLSGGIGPDEQKDILALLGSNLNIFSLDLNSKFEISPGIKNTELLSDFIQSF